MVSASHKIVEMVVFEEPLELLVEVLESVSRK